MSKEMLTKEQLFEDLYINDCTINEIAEKNNIRCGEVYLALANKHLLREDLVPKRGNIIYPTRTCAYCGKAFIWNFDWAYYSTYKKKKVYFHRYNCKTAFEKNLKERT